MAVKELTYFTRLRRSTFSRVMAVVLTNEGKINLIVLLLSSRSIVLFSGVVYHLHGQTGRITVWANGKQNSGLVNSVPDSRLPFAQISPIYRKMTAKA